MSDSLERIYRAVPTVECKGLCAESCGPIGMSVEERRRITARGITIPEPEQALADLAAGRDVTCPALVNDRCTCYGDRPLICRLWGAVQSMPCPHGCTVTPGLLMDAGAQSLIGRSLRLDTSNA